VAFGLKITNAAQFLVISDSQGAGFADRTANTGDGIPSTCPAFDLIGGVFEPGGFCSHHRYFIVFRGLTTLTFPRMPAYHQVHAVDKTMSRRPNCNRGQSGDAVLVMAHLAGSE